MATPHLTKESFEQHAHHDVKPHEHAVFVYDEETDILVPLAQFIEQGAREGDLSVFVHSFPHNEAARAFVSAGFPDAPKHEADGGLAAAPYREAFERDAHIDYDHVGGVVDMLRATAARSGRRAPRIFVDASKNYFDAGRVDEWFAFERWLGPRLQAEVGLVCAYRSSDLRDPKVLAQVLETHQYRFDAKR